MTMYKKRSAIYHGKYFKLINNECYKIEFENAEIPLKVKVYEKDELLCTLRYINFELFLSDWHIIYDEDRKTRYFNNMYTKQELNEALSCANLLIQYYDSTIKTGLVTSAKLKKTNSIIKDLFISQMKIMDYM